MPNQFNVQRFECLMLCVTILLAFWMLETIPYVLDYCTLIRRDQMRTCGQFVYIICLVLNAEIGPRTLVATCIVLRT